MKQSIWKFVRTFGLLGLWLVAAFLLYGLYQDDSQKPKEHFHLEEPGRLMTDGRLVLLTLAVMTAELIVLYLILRPWSYHRSIARTLTALGSFVVLTVLSFIALNVSDYSSYVSFHCLWLLIIDCILAVCALVSGISVLAMKRR